MHIGRKERQSSEDANNEKVLSVNYTLGKEMSMLVPDLVYKHTAVGFG